MESPLDGPGCRTDELARGLETEVDAPERVMLNGGFCCCCCAVGMRWSHSNFSTPNPDSDPNLDCDVFRVLFPSVPILIKTFGFLPLSKTFFRALMVTQSMSCLKASRSETVRRGTVRLALFGLGTVFMKDAW